MKTANIGNIFLLAGAFLAERAASQTLPGQIRLQTASTPFCWQIDDLDLDYDVANEALDAPVVGIGACDATDDRQQFRYDGGDSTIRPLNDTSFCLEFDGNTTEIADNPNNFTGNVTSPRLKYCNSSDANQRWLYNDGGFFDVRKANSAVSDCVQKGGPLELSVRECDEGNPVQQWTFGTFLRQVEARTCDVTMSSKGTGVPCCSNDECLSCCCAPTYGICRGVNRDHLFDYTYNTCPPDGTNWTRPWYEMRGCVWTY